MSAKKQGGKPSIEPVPEGVTDTALPQRRTKQTLLLELIGREGGATLTELTSVTGWLPHTTRAEITGLRKRGHDVRCERIDGVSRYMVGAATSEVA